MDVVARACSSIMLSASTVRDTIMKKADECEGSQTDACDASAVTHVSGCVCSCISCTAALLNGAWMSCGKRDLASCGTHHRFFHEILRPTRKEAALHGCDKRLHWQAGRVRARPACSEGRAPRRLVRQRPDTRSALFRPCRKLCVELPCPCYFHSCRRPERWWLFYCTFRKGCPKSRCYLARMAF